MGNAQSYARNPEGYYVMQNVCLHSDDGSSCIPTAPPAADDSGNSFYRIKNPAASSSYTSSMFLHTPDKKSLFYARNALGDAKALVAEAIVKPLYYFSQHPDADWMDEAVKEQPLKKNILLSHRIDVNANSTQKPADMFANIIRHASGNASRTVFEGLSKLQTAEQRTAFLSDLDALIMFDAYQNLQAHKGRLAAAIKVQHDLYRAEVQARIAEMEQLQRQNDETQALIKALQSEKGGDIGKLQSTLDALREQSQQQQQELQDRYHKLEEVSMAAQASFENMQAKYAQVQGRIKAALLSNVDALADGAIIRAKDFDAKQLYIDPVPQRNKSGGKYVRIAYGPKKQTLKLQSPVVYMPFGVGSFQDDKGVTTQSIEVSLRGYDDAQKPAMQAFYKALTAIDEAVLVAAEANSKAWFGKELPKALLQEFQRTLVKPPRDPKYAPLFKAKAMQDFKTGEMPKIYDAGDTVTVHPLDYVVRGTSGKILVTMPSIYLISKTFGLASRLLQMVVTNRPVQEEGCLFVSDDEDDDDAPPSSAAAAAAAAAAPQGPELVDDDDDDASAY
ncbi:hypothetical protein OEZ85_010995 [Tetradesmus obliquus]|uniref:Uncharacterized protein n=1 Tax=Tetradesmus obliquus TaxID=3088 RepID=A0ABY8TNY3_TETOB|nr:hypothetical protein OEZ85_010995 [Tetradesmus obliquus]